MEEAIQIRRYRVGDDEMSINIAHFPNVKAHEIAFSLCFAWLYFPHKASDEEN